LTGIAPPSPLWWEILERPIKRQNLPRFCSIERTRWLHPFHPGHRPNEACHHAHGFWAKLPQSHLARSPMRRYPRLWPWRVRALLSGRVGAGFGQPKAAGKIGPPAGLASPMGFLFPKLEPCLPTEARKTGLTQLQPGPLPRGGPCPGHNCRLPKRRRNCPKKLVEPYSFKLPNHEVSPSCCQGCCAVLFTLGPTDALQAKGDKPPKAILEMGSKIAGDIFRESVMAISWFKRPG
jgi:hypothetical protein